jgi:hypothetical protein
MRKRNKIIVWSLGAILLLMCVGWMVFDYYWRTRATITTFSRYSEHEVITPAKIRWKAASYGDFKTDISSFYVPVQLNSIDRTLYMQFDTGTPRTVLYGKTLATLKQTYTFAKERNSKSRKNTWQSDITLQIGSSRLWADELLVLSHMGTATIDSSFTVIGTLGYDVLLDRKLLLNFKENEFLLTEKSKSQFEYNFSAIEDSSIDRFPMLLPAKVDGKNVSLHYDSGSSMFPLIVDQKRFENLTNTSVTDTLCCVRSWGKSYEFYRKQLHSTITLGEFTTVKPYIYSTKSMEQYQYFPDWLLMGLMGNVLFMDKVLWIDTNQNFFGVAK